MGRVLILIYDNNNVDVAGIIITDDIDACYACHTAEVLDVSTGKSCLIPQLPDKRTSHTQVIH